MIYTVTFNPCLDYVIHVKTLQPGLVNRTESEEIVPGGKGINVSLVLHNLGIESTALGFSAGFTGAHIEALLDRAGCKTDFIPIEDGFSRINVKLKAEQETEINGRGPHIGKEALDRLYHKLDTLKSGDMLVLAGSIPATLPASAYEDICARLAPKGVQITVDATGDLLVNVLPYHPFLVKPNHHELGEIFHTKITTRESAKRYAKQLQEQGAANVLVSMAGEGAVLAAQDGALYESEAPKGNAVNSTGAGDSMVAGFLAGYLSSGDLLHALRMGLSTGSATAFSSHLATREEVEAVFRQFQQET